MNYIEITFNVSPPNALVNDVLTALAAEAGCDSFDEHDSGLRAYIPEDNFDPKALEDSLKSVTSQEKVDYQIKIIAEKNWNEEWEKNYFKPINVDGRCLIHSTFHEYYPQAEYEIIIDPKMAFGTGHHATTAQMVSTMLDMDFQHKAVLDMGCGTGVLAILAAMKGAGHILAIDIDRWAYDNALENMRINEMANIEVKCGDASLLGGRRFDIILANINRNILLKDMSAYTKCLSEKGKLLMSGFYSEDLPLIQKKADQLDLTFNFQRTQSNWTVVGFSKK